MNLLFKLTDKDFGLEPKEMKNFELRTASRGLIFGDDGKIAIQFKTKKNEYKLVGGGMEIGENPEIAFKREALEEAGCEIEIISKLGIIEEYRSLNNLKQIDNIYLAKVIKNIHELNLDKKEEIEGAKLIWESPKDALKLIAGCYEKLKPSEFESVYSTRFVILRDKKILEYYLKEIEAKI